MKSFINAFLCISCFLLLGSYAAFSQVKKAFDTIYTADITGELTFAANNIVSAQGGGRTPNDPYNLTGNASDYNDRINMQYIDVDGDAATFSSSSAVLTVPDPDCSLVRYAGLYWSAVYVEHDRSTIDRIKFKTPGGVYQDIIADDILFDGDGDVDFGNYSPYAAYKDVTSIVSSLADPNGEYTVANVRASSGNRIRGGISGGWTLVVVYENPTLPGRYITLFNGYAGIKSGASLDIPVSGFTTLPAPFPVNAKIGVATLEGDNRIRGDGLSIDAFGAGTFQPLSNSVNPVDNFFNSNITRNDAIVMDRTPNSINTLGWDMDLIDIPNANKDVIPNGATSAVLRATSSQDKYDIFFFSFDVEIIAPKIVLEKKVNTPGGHEITGQGVHLGQILDYVLSFQNIGNDDADQYTIRDVLPPNVSPPYGRTNFIASDFSLPPGVTYVYTPATREVVFSIPNNLVAEDDPIYTIRMRVQVAKNCFDFIDACSDLIQNLAYSTYRGVENSALITDDPSVTDFNACGFVVPGATNFLLDDLTDCNFERAVELCGDETVLDAGNGFDSYVWYKDENKNNSIDSTDTVITDSDPDNDPSTMTVTQEGVYIVDKIIADPCKGFKEIITVTPYGAGLLPNPIIEYFNEVNSDADPNNDIAGEIVQCSVDNDLLPKLFICGVEDTKQLQVNIVDAHSLVWEKLDEGSCLDSGDDCANKALNCTWSQVGTGGNYIVNSEGKYRLSVTYQNGCTSRFYFNVFQNMLDIPYTKKDIVCTTNGNITITNLGNGYGYQLINDDTDSIVVPFSANNGSSFDFAPGESGSYIVQVTQLDTTGSPIANACIFNTPVIGILDRDVTYNVTSSPAICNDGGSITIQINNAEPNYTYELRLDDGANGGQGTVIDDETAQPDNNFTFSDLNPGNYIASVRSTDGCTHTESITVLNSNDLTLTARVSQHITCKEGNILMDSGGGKTPHTYAIFNFEDESGTEVISYPSPQDIPSSEFQSSQIFDILVPGKYTFAVIDRYGCMQISNTVTIEFRPVAEFGGATVIDQTCYGETSGSIQMNLIDDNGYQLTYYLFNYLISVDDVALGNFDINNAIATNASGYFGSLNSGEYTIVVNMRKGSASCNYPYQHSIEGPENPFSGESALLQEYTCLQEGIIEAQNVTGGTAPYSYSIDGVNFIPDTTPNAHRFENLQAGTFTIRIRDAAGCVYTTEPIVIEDLNEPSDLSFTATAPNCPDEVSDVTVTVTGGTPNFRYEIIAPASAVVDNEASNVFTGLESGTYTFSITDDKGCTFQEDFTIYPIEKIRVAGVLDNNITCYGLVDGGLTYTVTNFTNTYDYTVTGPSNFSASAQNNGNIPLTGLASGTYTISVTDNITNCTDTAEVTIAAPPAALIISGVDVTDLTCSAMGTVPGAVVITATDGWGGYEYELESPLGAVTGPQSTNSFAGLTDTSGDYTVTVRDAGGCEVSQIFNLNPTVAPVLDLAANSLCYDSAIGLILTANVTSGGEAPFQYRLNGGVYQSGTVFTGLAPGNHTVEVIDSKNCTATASLEVFPTLTAAANLNKDLDCTASPDAQIEISISGGNPSFTYEVFLDGISFQASTAVPSNPFVYTTTSTGTYTFVITDSESCTITTNEVIVSDALPPTSVPIVVDASCNGEANGVVTLDISGGLPPYTVSFNGSVFTATTSYSGLSANIYPYTVRDSKGCEFNGNATVGEPLQILSSMTPRDVTCNNVLGGGNILGGIDVTITQGGVANYTYTLYDSANNIVTLGNGEPNPATSPNTTHAFNGVDFGDYYVRIVDANGCESDLGSVRVRSNPFLTLTSNVPPPDCPTGGTAVITATGGSGDYDFQIYDVGTLPNSETITDPSTEVATFTGLNPGQTYIIEAKDNINLCSSYLEVVIPPLSTITAVVDNTTDISCAGSDDGTMTFTVDNYDAGVNTIDWQILNSLTNTNVVGLGTYSGTVGPGPAGGPQSLTVIQIPPGDYVLLVREATAPSCTTTTTFRITEPTPVALRLIGQTTANCNADAEVSVGATGGVGPYSYAYVIDGATAPTVFPEPATFTLDPAVSLDWDVYARDSNGCIVATPLDVTIALDPTPGIILSIVDECVAEGFYSVNATMNVAGIAPYRIIIDGSAPQSAAGWSVAGDIVTLTNLSSGPHTIGIIDANGCGEVENISIEPELQITALANTQPSCNTNDGVIDFTISGGSGASTVQLLRSDLTDTGLVPIANQFIGVAFGDYIVRVTDTALGTPNCFADAPVSLEEPTPVTLLTPGKTDVSCAGLSDGTITINLAPTSAGVNDNPPYVFEITDGANTFTQNTGFFTDLPANTYDITVTSNRNCIATGQVIIDEPFALDAAITNFTPFSCDIDNSTQAANIEVTITSGTGTPNYFYSVNGGAFQPTGGNVFTYETTIAGNYDIVVRDQNGCQFPLPTQTIVPLNTFTANIATLSSITCDVNNPEEVLITVTDDGNPHNYTFELLPNGNPNGVQTSVTTTTANYDLMAVGNYTFRITDIDTGCYIDTPSYTIAPFDFIEVTAAMASPVICFGDGNGTLEFTISGYSGNYDYQVFDGNDNPIGGIVSTDTSVNPRTVGGLSGGNYYVTITETDVPLCDDNSNMVTIASPDLDLTARISVLAEATCTNDQGQILIVPTGGYAPYDIVVSNTTTGQPAYRATGVQSFVFSGLAAGDFEITITDAYGCLRSYTQVLNPATPIVANATPLVTNLACYGDTGAVVSANVTSGGSGDYEYQLNYYDDAGTSIVFTTGQQLNPNFNDLGAGLYSITVSDGWNCDVTTNIVEVREPTPIAAFLIRTDPLTCASGVEFELTATGGSGLYEYSTDNITFIPMTSNPMELPATGSFPAGTYQYYVRDAVNGCEAALSNAITEDPIEPLMLIVDQTAAFINCTGESTAIIYAEATGGMGNYQFQLFTDASLSTASRVAGPQPNGEFRNLTAGTYYVTVSSEDCNTLPEEVVIREPIPLSYTEEIVNVTCVGEDNGSITVTLSGGAGGYLYSISPNLDQFDTINSFTELVPGKYSVFAQDQNGCYEYLEYTITEPSALMVNAIASPETCVDSQNGTITVEVTGGMAPYSTALNSNDDADFVVDRFDFADMAVGNYLVFVRDANGCEANVIVDIAVGVNLNAEVTPVYECTSDKPDNYVNITLEDPSVIGDVLYALDTEDPSELQLNPDFRNIPPGDHYIHIVHDNGCSLTVDFTIEDFEPLTLSLEQQNLNEITAFAEGGREEYTYFFDGIDNGNDNTYYINRTDTFEVRVVDENGCVAIATIFMEFIDIEIPDFFTPDGDGNNEFWIPKNIDQYPEILIKIFDRYGRVISKQSVDARGWDGKYDGKELPTGDYWYIIQLNGENDEREFVGNFTLYR